MTTTGGKFDFAFIHDDTLSKSRDPAQMTPPDSGLAGLGTRAVLPFGTSNFRPIAGKWPAIMKDGTVFVHRMHAEANKLANGGVIGPEDAYGFVELDSTGTVIGGSWS